MLSLLGDTHNARRYQELLDGLNCLARASTDQPPNQPPPIANLSAVPKGICLMP